MFTWITGAKLVDEADGSFDQEVERERACADVIQSTIRASSHQKHQRLSSQYAHSSMRSLARLKRHQQWRK